MAERQDQLTALQACRPGSADLELPELVPLQEALQSDPALARQFSAQQRWDTAVREAVTQGDVPEGLQDRILAALDGADAPPTPSEPAQPVQQDPGSSHSRGFTRRRVGAALAAAATLAALITGAAVWSIMNRAEPLTANRIQERAVLWCDSLADAAWRETAAPRGFPFPREVRHTPDAWQRISIPEASGRAIAYRLPPPQQGVRSMTLLVLKAQATGLGPFPPGTPFRTMDRLVAAWEIGGNVYVLVIQGDDLGVLQDVYERHVHTQIRAA